VIVSLEDPGFGMPEPVTEQFRFSPFLIAKRGPRLFDQLFAL
jgi:hypothetical protein